MSRLPSPFKLVNPFQNYANVFFNRVYLNPLYLWYLCRLTNDYCKALKNHKKTAKFSKLFFTYGIEHSDFVTANFAGNTLVLTFCGSNDVIDWISNLMYFKDTDRDDVHGEFYDSTKRFRFFVRKLLSMYIDRVDYIVFNGHSRGGPLAEESNRFFKKMKEEQPELYGGILSEAVLFGSPKIGKQSYYNESASLSLKVTRFEYDNDIVCKLPPFKSFVKYGHIIALKKSWWHIMSFSKIISHLTYGAGLKRQGLNELSYL